MLNQLLIFTVSAVACGPLSKTGSRQTALPLSVQGEFLFVHVIRLSNFRLVGVSKYEMW